MSSLRIATYNIHKGVLNDFFGLKRVPVIHELRSRLHDLDADLIFLQEVQGHNARHASRFEGWPSEPQDVFLSHSPEFARVFENAYGNNANYLHGHHGNALLSRFPILHQETRDVSDHVLERRGILHCVVLIQARPVHCFCVHFGLFARSRERQIEALIEWIRGVVPSEDPVIVGGDFNDWRNRLSDRLCHALGMQEAFDTYSPPYKRMRQAKQFVTDRFGAMSEARPRETWPTPRRVRSARTFPSLVPWLRMDRIYLRGFEVRFADVMRGPSWARLSDHSPLITDVTLADARRERASG